LKICIFNMYYPPDSLGTGQIVSEIAHDLQSLGHRITVVTSVPHYGLESVPQEYAGRLFCRHACDGIDVVRTYALVPRHRTILGRTASFMVYTLLSFVAGLRLPRQDVLLCVAPPITLPVTTWLISRLRRAPMVVDLQDAYPDVIFPYRLAAWINKRLERFACTKASAVITIADGLVDHLQRVGARADHLHVIRNWADVREIQPLPKESSFRREHGLQGRFVVLYSGNIGQFGGQGIILDAAARLRDHPDIQFVFAGRGNAADRLRLRAAELRLDNVRFLPLQPRARLPEMLAAADLAVVTLDPRLRTTSVPSKTFTIMAAGRPVLAAMNADNEIARIVAEAGCGFCVPPDSPQQMADVILQAWRSPDLLDRFGHNGRQYVVAHHARHHQTRLYERLLTQLCCSHSPAADSPRPPV